jgi:hypothetical protein
MSATVRTVFGIAWQPQARPGRARCDQLALLRVCPTMEKDAAEGVGFHNRRIDSCDCGHTGMAKSWAIKNRFVIRIYR